MQYHEQGAFGGRARAMLYSVFFYCVLDLSSSWWSSQTYHMYVSCIFLFMLKLFICAFHFLMRGRVSTPLPPLHASAVLSRDGFSSPVRVRVRVYSSSTVLESGRCLGVTTCKQGFIRSKPFFSTKFQIREFLSNLRIWHQRIT